MKKIFLKVFLAVILPILLIGGSVAAYLALTATVDVSVDESLSWVTPNTYSVNLFPGESQTLNLIIHNESSADLTVTLKDKVTPKIKGLEITLPDTLNALAVANTAFDVVIVATAGVEPGTTQLTIDFER